MLPFWESLAMRFVYHKATSYDNLRLMAWNKLSSDTFYPFLYLLQYFHNWTGNRLVYLQCSIFYFEGYAWCLLSCVLPSLFLLKISDLSNLSEPTFYISSQTEKKKTFYISSTFFKSVIWKTTASVQSGFSMHSHVQIRCLLLFFFNTSSILIRIWLSLSQVFLLYTLQSDMSWLVSAQSEGGSYCVPWSGITFWLFLRTWWHL